MPKMTIPTARFDIEMKVDANGNLTPATKACMDISTNRTLQTLDMIDKANAKSARRSLRTCAVAVALLYVPWFASMLKPQLVNGFNKAKDFITAKWNEHKTDGGNSNA